MGNQQSDKTTTQSGEDTPDEHKSRCCEIPKKKGKEKGTKAGRSSRSDDTDFSPTDATLSDEQPVTDRPDTADSDPFEIVETEDIEYAPGVSSIDVIVSTSEGKFKLSKESENIVKITERQDSGGGQKIALEDYFPRHSSEIIEEINVDTEFQNEGRQEIQLENYFPRHSREIGDTEIDSDGKQNNTWDMAASTNLFANAQIQNEKRECKTTKSGKDKTKKDKRVNKVDVVVGDQARYYISPDQPQAQSMAETKQADEKADQQDSTESSDINACTTTTVQTTTESEQLAEQNDHLCISEKLTNSSANETDNNKLTTDNKCSTSEPNNVDNIPEVYVKHDENVYDSIDPTYRLYDTINRNKADTNDDSNRTGNNMYENIQALRESTRPSDVVKPPKGFGDSTGDDSMFNISSIEETQTEDVFEDTLEDISLSREMIIRESIEIKSNESTKENIGHEYKSNSENENKSISSKTDLKQNVSAKVAKHNRNIGVTEREEAGIDLEATATTEEDITPKCQSRDEENVPPPTPSKMDILEEQEESEDEDEGKNTGGNTVSEGMDKFGDSVCKRLSQLLEGQGIENMGGQEIATDSNRTIADAVVQAQESFNAFIENIDATSTGLVKPKSSEKYVPDSVTSQGYEQTNTETSNSNTEIHTNIKTSEVLNNGQSIDVSSRSNSAETLKRISGDSVTYATAERSDSSDDDGLPDYFTPEAIKPKRNTEGTAIVPVSVENVTELVQNYKYEIAELGEKPTNLQLRRSTEQLLSNPEVSTEVDELQDITPTAEAKTQLTALTELAKADDGTPVQYEGRHSIPCTESDLDISEQRDDMSTDSMLADDEAEETMEILFTKTYTEPVQGAEVFLSCTVVNSAYKNEQREAEQWLSDDALEYLEASASDIMSTAFMKAKKEMKDIQTCLQSLRKQMEHFHADVDDVRVPDTAMDSLSPDYMGLARKAVTD